ncbi:MAG: hypothetical protein IJW40_00580 [Clostridia bacterium]|nr:hypothetical protein [Clostridia bacterium]
MFYATFKTTLKTLTRSVIFYLALLLLFGVAVYEAIMGGNGYFSPELMEMIWDTDPRYVLSRGTFLQNINNACCAEIMMYAMPCFTVISTAVILGHSYGDRFYEIEKAGGIKPSTYLYGRLAAILLINVVIVTAACNLNHLWYVFSRGGVEGMSTVQVVAESFVRILRWVGVMLLPCILFYFTFTYALGSVFHSGVVGAAFGMGHVLFYYVVNLMLRHRIAPVYFDYLSPLPRKLRHFLYAYEQEAAPAADVLVQQETSLGKALICLGVLLGVAALYTALAYRRQKCRND